METEELLRKHQRTTTTTSSPQVDQETILWQTILGIWWATSTSLKPQLAETHVLRRPTSIIKAPQLLGKMGVHKALWQRQIPTTRLLEEKKQKPKNAEHSQPQQLIFGYNHRQQGHPARPLRGKDSKVHIGIRVHVVTGLFKTTWSTSQRASPYVVYYTEGTFY